MLTRDCSAEERKTLDDALLSRPGEIDPDTGLAPPDWWHGEEDMVASTTSFLSNLRR